MRNYLQRLMEFIFELDNQNQIKDPNLSVKKGRRVVAISQYKRHQILI